MSEQMRKIPLDEKAPLNPKKWAVETLAESLLGEMRGLTPEEIQAHKNYIRSASFSPKDNFYDNFD